jgi:hypothetical protein
MQKAHKERIKAEESSKIHSTFNMICSSVEFTSGSWIYPAKQMP